ncbi:hypothetical protein [Halococcus hamelinensis]|uniref:Uncharacterized protein n=1 Tax=Halococcus hamelinensis 100A6 TaxID=1132509 RepID=M0M696_9EURY|nr:hypothetical protein [Halococcus hamelinensis]EMA40134.1 hypothetical protein C447_04907 [Halococcus hamelinensis 100A6]
MGANVSSLLVGRDQRRSRRFSALAGVFALASTLVYTAIVLGGLPDTFPFMVGPVVVVLGAATVCAYLNDGLLVSGSITGLFAVGGIVAMHVDAGLGPVSYPVSLATDIRILAIFVGVGIAGSLVGAVARRVVTRVF